MRREATPVWGSGVWILLLSSQLAACNALTLRGGPGTEIPIFGGPSVTRSPGYSALVVRVFDDNVGQRTHGPPIPSAIVQLDPLGLTAEDVASAATDSLGEATFSQLAPGEYRVIVKAPVGYEAQTQTMTELTPNRTKILTLRIRRTGDFEYGYLTAACG